MYQDRSGNRSIAKHALKETDGLLLIRANTDFSLKTEIVRSIIFHSRANDSLWIGMDDDRDRVNQEQKPPAATHALQTDKLNDLVFS